MNLDQYCKKHGDRKKLAKSLSVSPALISRWTKGSRNIRPFHCKRIEEITKGLVTCEELRPDLNWTYLKKT